MCIFKENYRLVCRSVKVNNDASYTIIRDGDNLQATIYIGKDVINITVKTEDIVKLELQKELYKRTGFCHYDY